MVTAMKVVCIRMGLCSSLLMDVVVVVLSAVVPIAICYFISNYCDGHNIFPSEIALSPFYFICTNPTGENVMTVAIIRYKGV